MPRHAGLISPASSLPAGLVAILAALVSSGCAPATPSHREATRAAEAPPGAPAAASTFVAPRDMPGDRWYAQYIQGAKVGYGKTLASRFTEQGRELRRLDSESRLTLARFGDRSEMEVRWTSIETPSGEVLRFDSLARMGPVPARTTGRVLGGRMLIETNTAGKSLATEIPWSPEFRGFQADEDSLRAKPMQPGERREIRALLPLVNQVGSIELVAGQYESTRLLAGNYELLRVQNTVVLPDGKRLASVLWADRTGEVLKIRDDMLGMETYRATKEVALDKTGEAAFDLGEYASIKVDRPLPQPHDSQRVCYRVRLEGGDPAAIFVSCPTQQVRAIGTHTAELVVRSRRPDASPAGRLDVADPPTDEDRQPNSMIQSDDARIVAMAAKAAGDRTDPWQTALALERYVHDSIKMVNYTQAFATAAEVAKTGEGDCTEHSVLLAAVARARGIPARVAMGLVYIQSAQAFGYHMWDELYIRDRWIPMDATLAKGGIGAAHLKLAQSSLKGAGAYSAFLPVAQVLGRLKIEVLDEGKK
jgi:hypothetical protein